MFILRGAIFIVAGCGSCFKMLDLSFEDVCMKVSIKVSKERSVGISRYFCTSGKVHMLFVPYSNLSSSSSFSEIRFKKMKFKSSIQNEPNPCQYQE